MHIDFDPAKSERNRQERGLSFTQAAEFEFETALFVQDDRRDYGELRWRALGRRAGRVHVLVFTETDQGIRVISFRKANVREVEQYEQAFPR
jgi:uncharacterized protein